MSTPSPHLLLAEMLVNSLNDEIATTLPEVHKVLTQLKSRPPITISALDVFFLALELNLNSPSALKRLTTNNPSLNSNFLYSNYLLASTRFFTHNLDLVRAFTAALHASALIPPDTKPQPSNPFDTDPAFSQALKDTTAHLDAIDLSNPPTCAQCHLRPAIGTAAIINRETGASTIVDLCGTCITDVNISSHVDP